MESSARAGPFAKELEAAARPFAKDLEVTAGSDAKGGVTPAYKEDFAWAFVLPAESGVSDDALTPAFQPGAAGPWRQGRAGALAAPTLRCDVGSCLSLSLILS